MSELKLVGTPALGTQPPISGVPGKKEDQKPYIPFYMGPATQQTEIEGLSFDFNYGARIQVPDGKWKVRIIDQAEHMVLFETDVLKAGFVTSSKKYYIPFRLEVFQEDKLVFQHNMDLKGKKVLFRFPHIKILGDTIASFPYVEAFRKKHGCEVYCSILPELAELFEYSYPDIHYIGLEDWPEDIYAAYYIGYFKPCNDRTYHPADWRIVGMPKAISYTLGLDGREERTALRPKHTKRVIKEPYVCIATQATSQAKYWNNPVGWIKTIQYLKEKGYRVLCIDKEICQGKDITWNTIPYGCEDFTGNLPLQERIDLLYHADFFIGLVSGGSWLAWAAGKPVIMIGGFSLPLAEFETPYRIINYHTCTGCFSDSSIEFDNGDFLWCPRHKGTNRQFECTRLIMPERVCDVIDQLMADYGFSPQARLQELEAAATGEPIKKNE